MLRSRQSASRAVIIPQRRNIRDRAIQMMEEKLQCGLAEENRHKQTNKKEENRRKAAARLRLLHWVDPSHTYRHTHARRHTRRACLLSRRGSAPALNSTKVQGELKPGREASERQAAEPRLLPGVVGGVVRAGGQAALAPFRIHSALRWYIPALWGEERQWSSTAAAAAAPDSGAGSRGRGGGRRDGGGVVQRRRAERGNTSTHTRSERDSAPTAFSRSLPSLGPPSLLLALPVALSL